MTANIATRPLIFTDLDDTLFQTGRKITDACERQLSVPGALDRSLAPRSFMTPRQHNLVQWMLDSAETIPVTARGTEEIARVCIPFDSWAITTHGAVILTPTGQADPQWQQLITEQMRSFLPRLLALEQHLSRMLSDPQAVSPHLPVEAGWCRMNEEYGMPVYLVMKVNDSQHLIALNHYADWVSQTFDLDGFYVHRNGNNVAWLPKCIEKAHAVKFLLEKLRAENPARPALGFGDSLSDLSFMQQCDFLAIPQRSQLLNTLERALPAVLSSESHILQPESTPQTLLSGSYPPGDIHFLLAPVQIAFTAVEEKERLIQSGEKHYSEMLSQEPSPSHKHLSLYQHAMTDFGPRLAHEITALAKGLVAQVTARPIVLTSLVRAGVPLGVCLLHALRDMQVEAVHYGISIIRDRGLDETALTHITRQHGSAGVVFIDGWTGKGAISRQLTASLANRPEFGSPPRLAVLADPGGCAWLSASGDDWLMPFGILGAPVSGLVSRSLWRESGFHGSMFCQHLQPFDLSASFVTAVDSLRHQQTGNIPAAHPREDEKNDLQRLSEQVINRLAERFNVGSINHIKPGIAEATRAVMRRVPDHVLVTSKQDADVALLVHLAESLGIPVEEVGSDIGVYRAVTLIKPIP
ncbi:hypothetical protein GCM10011328_33030 [Hafnia psychrotolerans]|uniref:PELOTA RNA-binding domain-containing protein n=1 Tax=Hafnia psychrotolerans TaxID=1477018 RepID=A0ABQ1H1Y9_9GAMM|nr:hypothetical protein GCM10011328_33030 [Hafnia psychrotolerans]